MSQANNNQQPQKQQQQQKQEPVGQKAEKKAEEVAKPKQPEQPKQQPKQQQQQQAEQQAAKAKQQQQASASSKQQQQQTEMISIAGVEMPEHCVWYSAGVVALVIVAIFLFSGKKNNSYKKTDGDRVSVSVARSSVPPAVAPAPARTSSGRGSRRSTNKK